MSEGVLIDQRFMLGRVIRESGVAIVYEAMHRNGASGWLKLPRGPEHAASLFTEAKVANALGKRAVNVRDDGYTEQGVPYLVLEPVTGQRLDHWRAASGGRAPPDEALGLGDELCQAIGTMHQAGYAVGLLRTDAIIVLPKGGMCLLELEHAIPATPASMKEDVARVGRVLYEMLSGMPCLPASPPLSEAAPELPHGMLSTVDDAARGRYETIAELRVALRRSRPEWLGPMRTPMPSLAPDAWESAGPTTPREQPTPSGRGVLFDPRSLVESGRIPAARVSDERALMASAPVASMSVAPGAPSPSVPWRGPSPSELDAPPVAAFERAPPPRTSPPRTSPLLIVAGALASVLFLASIGLAAFMLSKSDRPAEVAVTAPPVAKNAAPSALTPAAAPAASRADDVIEVDDVTSPAAPSAAVTASAQDAGAAGAGETTFRFEGDRSPRLVIIDGQSVGVTTKPITVRCGQHTLRIGAKGAVRSLDLPCASEQTIVIERNGKWQAP